MSFSNNSVQKCFLHACGDVSLIACFLINLLKVFSTHVEMFLFLSVLYKVLERFLHACGDVSEASIKEASPLRVFSTHVEMFLSRTMPTATLMSFLHACGDVSILPRLLMVLLSFSPRMWRCFYCKRLHERQRGVFSTHVEMFPPSCSVTGKVRRFLHACGDVSSEFLQIGSTEEFSPRMWRCFFQ